MNWLLIFLGFSLLIILHEAGHFSMAKATGMRVERFFLFFPPKLVSVKRGETEYGIGAIPLGGFVKISGMNPDEKLPPGEEHRGYYEQPVWKRIVVIGAGPAVNVVLAFAILFFVAFSYPEATSTVAGVQPGSPAAAIELQPGDEIVAVDGKRYAGKSTEDRVVKFGEAIAAHGCPGEKPTAGCRASRPVLLGIEGPDGQRAVSVFPAYDEKVKRMRIGVEYDSVSAASDAGGAASFAADWMWSVTSGTLHVFSHIFEDEERKQISGVVGVSDVANRVIDVGVVPSLLLLALVSLSLGLINLFPFLPLDGGHIFWSLVEKARGTPVPFQVMERAGAVGFVLVIMLFFLGLSNDIGRLTGDGFDVR